MDNRCGNDSLANLLDVLDHPSLIHPLRCHILLQETRPGKRVIRFRVKFGSGKVRVIQILLRFEFSSVRVKFGLIEFGFNSISVQVEFGLG